MPQYSIRSIDIDAAPEKTFALIADAKELPRWTNAFTRVENETATTRTPRGEVDIELAVHASRHHGTVDWEMRFPDGSVEWAYSRVVPSGPNRSIFSFVLLPPSAALESIEGVLEEQSAILEEELQRLKRLLEDD